MMKATHKNIEVYLDSNLPTVGIKYSFNRNNARDFTLPNSPLLYDGADDHIVVSVRVENSGAADVGNKYRRIVGTIRLECYINEQKSDRVHYELLDKLRSFLEATSFNGIYLKDFSVQANYLVGKWNVTPAIVSFRTTAKRI